MNGNDNDITNVMNGHSEFNFWFECLNIFEDKQRTLGYAVFKNLRSSSASV